MTLAAVRLDDLEWQQMVDAVRGRIVARSDGKWTMHAAVDPGITLLELFAYQFEQRLYWMDQVPEQTMRALLAMLDDAPFPTRAAQTVLSLAPLGTAMPQTIDAGTKFMSGHLERPQPMSSRESVSVLPINTDPQSAVPHRFNVSVTAGGADRSLDLKNLETVELLPADGSAAAFHLTLWLDRTLDPAEIGGSCHILLGLDTPERIVPEWAPLQTELTWPSRLPEAGYDTSVGPDDISEVCGLKFYEPPGLAPAGPGAASDDDPLLGLVSSQWALSRFHVRPAAELRWAYSTGGGAETAFDDASISDGTIGLRRSGILRISIPAGWQPDAVPAAGPLPYRISVYCERCNFSSPPVLRKIVPNVVVAQNVECVTVPWLRLSGEIAKWLRLPGQTLRLLADRPPPIENSIRLFLKEKDDEWYRWQPTDHLYRHGPTDRVFVVDRDKRTLTFGNGVTGRIPVLSDAGATARLGYLAGGGADGNLAEQGWLGASLNNAVLSVVDAIGGDEAEAGIEAQARTATDLQRVERAVTAGDYVTLATTTPGVAVERAHAAVGLHPDFPCQTTAGAVTVVIVPWVPRPEDALLEDIVIEAPVSDPGEVRAVAERLEPRRMVGHEVFVQPVTYRAVKLIVELDGIVLDEKSLRMSIRRQLAAFLDPLIGGFDGEGWPFGEPLRPSTLLRQINVLLVHGVTAHGVSIALDTSARFESCDEVDIGPHNLVYLSDLDVRINRRPAVKGGLS